LTLGGVEIDIGLQPWRLLELDRPMDLGDPKSVIHSLLQVPVVDLVSVLMVESGEEFRLFGTCKPRK